MIDKQTSNIAGSKSFGFLVSPFNTYNQETNNSLKQKLENKTCTFRYSERQNGSKITSKVFSSCLPKSDTAFEGSLSSNRDLMPLLSRDATTN